jgi:hypothetical protein
MRLRHWPPRQGLVWVRQGLRVFLRRPLAITALFFIYALIGPMLMFAVAPLATLGFMIATQQALRGRFAFFTVFVQPLQGSRAQRIAHLQLGVLYAVGVALIFWLSDAVGGAAFDALREVMGTGREVSAQELQRVLSDPSLQAGWLIMTGGISLLAVPFWHAPGLVHWDNRSAGKALFFSVVACWRNKGALLMYALGWVMVVTFMGFAITSVFALLGMPQIAFAAATPAMLTMSAAFYASLYFTFADTFEPSLPVAESLPSAPESA